MDPQQILKQAQDFMTANPNIGLGLIAFNVMYILYRIISSVINGLLVIVGLKKKESFGLLDSVKQSIADARRKLGV
jgi:hypothetical protein